MTTACPPLNVATEAPSPPRLPLAPWHPLLPVFDEEQVVRMLSAGKLEEYVAWHLEHQQRIARADWDEAKPVETDPYRDGFRLPCWWEAKWLLGLMERSPETRAQLREAWEHCPYVNQFHVELRNALGLIPDEAAVKPFDIWIGLGGNRATKSEFCAWTAMESLVRVPGTTLICVSDSLETSRNTQQWLIWKYLPIEFKRLNRRNDRQNVFRVEYSKANGFGLQAPKLILPHGSQVLFKTYNQDPNEELEGYTIGSKSARVVAAWLDENASTGWFEVVTRRAAFVGGVVLWSFTPIRGMTQAIRDVVGPQARTLKSLPAELLGQGQRHVPDCPAGQMPYLARPKADRAIVHYFFSQFNPFGTHEGTFYESVKKQLRNGDGTPKASTFIKRIAHGYTEDVAGRKFPAFCQVHIRRVEHLPERGSMVLFVDPHGSRPYFHWWVLVEPGDPPVYNVVREWPDVETYGEWAVPTQRQLDDGNRRGADGDRGPAQRELGWGVLDYKRLWLEKERVHVPDAVREYLRSGVFAQDEWTALLLARVKYPWHRRIISDAVTDGAFAADQAQPALRERVTERFMDKRFCNTKQAAIKGQTCLRWLFEEEQRDANGQVLAPAYGISEASGQEQEDGWARVSDLLSYEREAPQLIDRINTPHLYVSEECQNTIWAFENFTGLAGQEGACKEPIDLARHLAHAEPRYIAPRKEAKGQNGEPCNW